MNTGSFSLEEEKQLVLLASVLELGGAPSKSRVLDHILDSEYLVLSDKDLSILDTRDEETWRNDMAFVRKHLVDSGMIDSGVHDRWRITPQGKEYLQVLVHKADRRQLTKATSAALEQARVQAASHTPR
jgi:hypothetical protein